MCILFYLIICESTYFVSEDGTTQWTFPGDPPPEDTTVKQEAEPQPEPAVAAEAPEPETLNPMTSSTPTSLGKSLTELFLRIALFPFTDMIPLIIYLVVLIVFHLVEMIIGFACLGYWVHRNDGWKKYNLLQAWMIVDALISLAQTGLHVGLLWTPCKELFSHTQNLPSIQELSIIPFLNGKKLFPSNSTLSSLFTTRYIVFCLLFVFQFVWDVVGMCASAMDEYNNNNKRMTGFMFFAGLSVVVEWAVLGGQLLLFASFYLAQQHAKKSA